MIQQGAFETAVLFSRPKRLLQFPYAQFFKFIPKATGSFISREQTRNPPCGYEELRGLLGLWLFTFFTSLELFDQDCHCLYTRDVQFSRSVVSGSLRPHGLQHARPLCLSPVPGIYSDSCPLNRWCHTTISSSVVPFSSCLNLSQYQGLFKWVSSSNHLWLYSGSDKHSRDSIW